MISVIVKVEVSVISRAEGRGLSHFRDLYYKQLLDEVFVISGIIKIELTVISRAENRVWQHLQRLRLFRISQKRNLIIVLLYIVFQKITPSQGT